MKSDAVRRSVKSRRYVRSAGDAPALGKIARMPGSGIPTGERRRRRRGERSSQKRPKIVLFWSVLLGVGTIVLLSIVVFLWLSPNLDRKAVSSKKAAQERVIEERVPSRFASPGEKEAIALVKAGLAVTQPGIAEEKFITGSSTPEQIISFLQSLPYTDGALDRLEWQSSVDANGLQLDGVLVQFSKEDKVSQRIAFLTPDEQGNWKIDFDSFARTVTPSWEELLEKSAPKAVVRVIIGNDSYYNGPFSDDKQWICYGMVSLDTDQLMLGYCKIGSPQAAALEWIFTNGGRANRVTLEIARVEGGASKQFEIVKVVAQDWVRGPELFEDSFK
jgi:hypothetical protein